MKNKAIGAVLLLFALSGVLQFLKSTNRKREFEHDPVKEMTKIVLTAACLYGAVYFFRKPLGPRYGNYDDD